jgi:hypothetical protein
MALGAALGAAVFGAAVFFGAAGGWAYMEVTLNIKIIASCDRISFSLLGNAICQILC